MNYNEKIKFRKSQIIPDYPTNKQLFSNLRAMDVIFCYEGVILLTFINISYIYIDNISNINFVIECDSSVKTRSPLHVHAKKKEKSND